MAEADRPIKRPEGASRIGYRATFFGENVSKENARIEPVDPERQARFEAMMWKLAPGNGLDPAE